MGTNEGGGVHMVGISYRNHLFKEVDPILHSSPCLLF